MDAEFIVENEYITEDVMIQYEAFRQLGYCNMFDYGCVTGNAEMLGFSELAELSREDYKYLIGNFSALMKYYNVKQTRETVQIAMDAYGH